MRVDSSALILHSSASASVPSSIFPHVFRQFSQAEAEVVAAHPTTPKRFSLEPRMPWHPK